MGRRCRSSPEIDDRRRGAGSEKRSPQPSAPPGGGLKRARDTERKEVGIVKGPNQVALVMAAIVALAVGRRAGHTLDELREAAIASVGTGAGAIFILFAVGAQTGTWAMCGTLLTMVY